MVRAYARCAAAFVVKPAGDDEVKQCAIAIQGSWDQVWLPV